jgi:hypothetical protein
MYFCALLTLFFVVFIILLVSRRYSSHQTLRVSTDIKSRGRLMSLLPGIDGDGDVNRNSPLSFETVQTNDLYKVDFDPSILEIIGEVKYLERLGFKVPIMARNIAMLEEVFILNVNELNQMLKRYYSTLALLDDVQVSTL